jgi:hypothetical protein
MKDLMETNRKRELKKKWQRQQRTASRAALPLPDDQMKALFEYLDVELPKLGCDDTRRITEQWLRDHNVEVDRVLGWFDNNGGFCDCDVLANCEEAWEEAIREG